MPIVLLDEAPELELVLALPTYGFGFSSSMVEKTRDASSDGNWMAALTQIASRSAPRSWCSCVLATDSSEYAGHHCISAAAG